MSAMSADVRRFALIDAMRGLGALAIACHHIHRYTPRQELVNSVLPDAVQWMLRNGWYGVQMFWVIAGFVLAYSLREAKYSPIWAGSFTARRVLRLGSPYWVAILTVVALSLATNAFIGWPPPDEDIGWAKLAANFAFLQDILGLGNISAGTWFVCVDLQLGLAVAAMLWLAKLAVKDRPVGGRADLAALTVLFIPLGLAALFWLNFEPRFNAWIIYYFHLPLLGMLTWWAIEGRVPKLYFWGYLAVLAAAAVSRWRADVPFMDNKKLLELIVAITTGSAIYVAARRGHFHDWLSAGWLQYFGRISYSLFLIHYPISWIVLQAGSRVTGDSAAAAVALLFLALAASIGAAHLLYKFVESPSLRLCAKLKAGG